MSQQGNAPQENWIRLERSQALDLVEKLLRDVEALEMCIDDDLSIALRPVGTRAPEPPRLPPSEGDQAIVLETATGDVWVEGQLTPTLTAMEFGLLSHLYSRRGKIVSAKDVCQVLWPEHSYEDMAGALHKLVSRLRAKLEPEPAKPRYLITVRGRGYRLNVK